MKIRPFTTVSGDLTNNADQDREVNRMNAISPPPVVKAAKPYYQRVDSAYGCFAFVVFVVGFGPLLSILPIIQGDKEGFAMLFGVPLMFGAFIAGIAGLVLSIVHWREWPLGAMAVASVAFVLAWNFGEETIEIAAIFYVSLLVCFCGRWFFFRRRKMKQAGRF